MLDFEGKRRTVFKFRICVVVVLRGKKKNRL